MCYTQNRFKALISACVMSLIATAGWSAVPDLAGRSAQTL
jgi:hypothetical protein